MAEVLELTAVQARDAIAAGDLSPAEYGEAWAAAAAGDDLNAYLCLPGNHDGNWLAPERPTLAPIAVKDIFCT
jgi:hypothetical protein